MQARKSLPLRLQTNPNTQTNAPRNANQQLTEGVSYMKVEQADKNSTEADNSTQLSQNTTDRLENIIFDLIKEIGHIRKLFMEQKQKLICIPDNVCKYNDDSMPDDMIIGPTMNDFDQCFEWIGDHSYSKPLEIICSWVNCKTKLQCQIT